MMHDTTCVPALVDLAAARDGVAAAGGDPRALDPVIRVDVSTDHSIAVDHFGTPDAMRLNLAREAARNAERFRLMKWASQAMANLIVHPPGTGIMHTLNLERLATVVSVEQRDGERWLIPDTLIGTDSHTPMVNGIGVLAWGVGGLEAEAAMLGAPVMLRVPGVVGVRLAGTLREGVFATDLALARDCTACARSISPAASSNSSAPASARSPPASVPWSPTWRPNMARRPAISRSTRAPSSISSPPAAAPKRPSRCAATPGRRACGSIPTPRPITI